MNWPQLTSFFHVSRRLAQNHYHFPTTHSFCIPLAAFKEYEINFYQSGLSSVVSQQQQVKSATEGIGNGVEGVMPMRKVFVDTLVLDML